MRGWIIDPVLLPMSVSEHIEYLYYTLSHTHTHTYMATTIPTI